uniref:Uncharacterized protein n=1 Tax=Brassica oleracea TaxID=3712 RepID=A0A3P6B5G9_BRAOL|nr:unnamed protein product [Brassica oleracea]
MGIAQGVIFVEKEKNQEIICFFACSYTYYTLWFRVIGSLVRPNLSPDLNEIVPRVSIYYIWRERNERRHTQVARPVEHLSRIIDKKIRQRILSTRYYEKPRLAGLLQLWFSAHME